MYKIINISASRDEGCWYHSPTGFSPYSHTLQIEPWIAGMQLKLYEVRELSLDQYEGIKDYLKELSLNRIVKVIPPPVIEKIVLEKEEIKEPIPKKLEKVFDLSDVPIIKEDTKTNLVEDKTKKKSGK
jgi:hypothetical protein